MTEDMDKDLQDLLGDMDIDAGAEGSEAAGGDEDSADMDLDGALGGDEEATASDDLGDLDLGDLGGGEGEGEEAAAAGDEGGDLDLSDLGGGGDGDDLDLGDLGGGAEAGGGEGDDLDLGDLGGSEEGGAGEAPSAATPQAEPQRPRELQLDSESAVNMEFLLDIKLNVTFEVGRAKMMCSDLLTLGQGSVIELHRLVGDELDLLVNGRLVAKGEVVVVNEKFGCKITSIISPEDRVKHLGGL